MKTGLKNAIMNAQAPIGETIIINSPSSLGRITPRIKRCAANTIHAVAYQCVPHHRNTARTIFHIGCKVLRECAETVPEVLLSHHSSGELDSRHVRRVNLHCDRLAD